MPSGVCVYNVVSCVDHVVLIVVIVVICCCCDDCVHGEPLVVKWWFLGGKFVFLHCCVFKTGITLWILRLKLWGLMFWKAYDFSYKFDVLSFCI